MGNRTNVPARVRRAVLARDNSTCRYCGNSDGPFQVDHVRPYSWGGSSSLENLVTACGPCNMTKLNQQWTPRPLPRFSIPMDTLPGAEGWGMEKPAKIAAGRLRRTKNQVAVAAELLGSPAGRNYGYQIWLATGVKPGVLYPMLARFEESGLIISSWQEFRDMNPGQSLPRRYYTLTDKGRAELGALVNGRRKSGR